MKTETLCALASEKRCETQCFTCMDDERCDKSNTPMVRVTPIDTGEPFEAFVIDETNYYYVVTPIGTEKTQAWSKAVCELIQRP